MKKGRERGFDLSYEYGHKGPWRAISRLVGIFAAQKSNLLTITVSSQEILNYYYIFKPQKKGFELRKYLWCEIKSPTSIWR